MQFIYYIIHFILKISSSFKKFLEDKFLLCYSGKFKVATSEHRNHGICSVRSINAEVLEGLVLKRIEEITQNGILLQRLVSKASGEASFKVKDLEEKRVLLKFRIKELEKKGSLLANKLIEIEGKSAERFILKEIEAVDKSLKELEEELKRI